MISEGSCGYDDYFKVTNNYFVSEPFNFIERIERAYAIRTNLWKGRISPRFRI